MRSEHVDTTGTDTTGTEGQEVRQDDRRGHQRVRLDTKVGVHTDTNFFNGFAEDLSEGGLFVATYELLPVGTGVDLTFCLPDERTIVAHGTVRWLRDPRDPEESGTPGMGVQFDGLSEEALEAVHEFVAERAPLFWTD